MTDHRFLLLDIGAGTLDILFYDGVTGEHYKAVVISPVRMIARQIADSPGNLIITGYEMGGGPVSAILKKRAADSDRVVMTETAAATLHHHSERVKGWGIEIVSSSEAEELIKKRAGTPLEICDLQIDRLARIIEGFGIDWNFDVVAVCAQDHGVAPVGVSHLDYRHNLFKERLDKTPSPAALIYEEKEIPETMSRLTGIAHSARKIPAKEIFVMDSGMAAICGAATDPQLQGKKRFIVLDIATSHTVGAVISNGLLDGFFEYHTHDITTGKIEALIKALADGDLSHQAILSQGGHGAYIRKAHGFAAMEAILATGPKRNLLQNSQLSIAWGAPMGDNMMTGTSGLLEALRQRKKMPPFRA